MLLLIIMELLINEAINTFKQTLYAIGDVFLTYSVTELPATKFGGSWELASKGRVLLGVDPAQSQFNQGMKIGGSFNIPVTITNMPGHTHATPQIEITSASDGEHAHAVTTVSVASVSTTPGATGGQSANHTHDTTTNSDLRCISNGATASPGWLWGQNVPNAAGYENRIVSDFNTGTQSANHTHTSAAHVHTIPALSGTAASNGDHTQTIS